MRDGLLRIDIPALPETPDVNVSVSAAAPTEDLSEPRASAQLPVPGCAAEDVTVVIKEQPSSRTLLIFARGSLLERLRLPMRSLPAQAAAWCVNGLLSVSVPLRAVSEEAVPINATALRLPETPSTDVSLLSTPVPGLAATDISATLRGRALQITSAKAPAGGRPLALSLRLPPGLHASDLRASCQHGLLNITTARPAPMRRTVPLNAPEPAAAEAEMVEAEPEAAGPTAEPEAAEAA